MYVSIDFYNETNYLFTSVGLIVCADLKMVMTL